MSHVTIWAQRGPIDTPWQLGDLATADPGHTALLGWDEFPSGVDGGVPAPVARAWSEALCTSARVTFLSPASPGATADWTVAG